MYSNGIALHPLQKSPLAPVARQLAGGSQVKLPLKMCRDTGGCSSYACECRTTLCTYGPNLADKGQSAVLSQRLLKFYGDVKFPKHFDLHC